MSQAGGRGGHAVVIGASMAGLAIAKALTKRFERVTVLDRDRLPDEAVHRNGVPQGRHVHVLLAAGADALEELFPGLLDEMVSDGAPSADLDRVRPCFNGHRLARGRIGRDGIAASRPFLEAHVRWQVEQDPAITLTGGMEVRGLEASPDRRRVVGVRVGSRAGEGADRTLAADLVVDCSGRRSPLPEWLEALGYARPAVDQLTVDVRYATRHYWLPPEALDGDIFVLAGPTADGPRGGALNRIEGDRWLVTLFGMGGERPPLDADEYEAFAAGFPISDLHDALRQGKPLDDPVAFRYPANVRHRYERLRDFPAGLLVAGDAVCSFNPIYGQGMSVAALEAVALRRLLADGGAPAPRAWFAAIKPVVDVAWNLAVGADMGVRAIEGRRSPPIRVLNGYIRRFHAAAAYDPDLTNLFMRVAGLLDPPSLLLRPGTVARVLRGSRRRVRPEGASAPAGTR